MPRPRSRRLRGWCPIALTALALSWSGGQNAVGGIILEATSSSTVTFSVQTLDTNTSGLTSPRFDGSGALIFPGLPDSRTPGTYPMLDQTQPPVVTQTPNTVTSARDGQNINQMVSVLPSVIDPTVYGTGKLSTTESSLVPGNGAVAGNAGVSYNAGSFVQSSVASDPHNAIVSVTNSLAKFRVTGLGYSSLAPGVFLDVAGYVRGQPGSFVAVGLSGSISIVGPGLGSVPALNFQLVGAYAGPGTQVTPAGALGIFNTTSPPAGFQFEAVGGLVFSPFTLVSQDSVITIQSTLTLIADPDSYIQLYAGSGAGRPVPDFGVFAGGPIDLQGTVATPEPSTWIGLLTSATVACLLRRRGRVS